MLERLTLITPTGDRPEAFGLCVELMAAQTYPGDVRWIIVDDGSDLVDPDLSPRRLPDNWSVDYMAADPVPGQNTQGRNLQLGLELAISSPTDLIVFIEDDDFYAPAWLERLAMIGAERDEELLGEGSPCYYNVAHRRYWYFPGRSHTSLKSTAIRGSAIYSMAESLKVERQYYDLDLWARHSSRYLFESGLTVGIKGLPGRPGIAAGHHPRHGHPDPFKDEFYRTLGGHSEIYEPFLGEPNAVTPRMRVLSAGEGKIKFAPLKAGDLFAAPSKRDAKLLELYRWAELVEG